MNQIKLERYYVILAMKLIREEESFKEEFLKIAQPIYADVISFVQNPNCTCKNRVGKFIGENRALVIGLINVWDQQNPNKINIDKVEEENKIENVQGKVFIIPRNPESFENFMKDSKEKKYSYKGFTVADNGNEWSIFFY